jgi:hypothetical protein
LCALGAILPDTRVGAIASEDGDALGSRLDFAWLEVSTKGSMRRQCRDGYGPAAQSRPASARKTARSGHAVAEESRTIERTQLAIDAVSCEPVSAPKSLSC